MLRSLVVAGLLTLTNLSLSGSAYAASGPRLLTIGVDHIDLANQQAGGNRWFAYTDFFSRDIRVHAGDTLDFRTAPGAFHIIALAGDEDAARTAYPLVTPDRDNTPAVGSGEPKLVLGASFGSIVGGSTHGGGAIGRPNSVPPSTCGLTAFGQMPCTFTGTDDVESQGGVAGAGPAGPTAVDWLIRIDAPAGAYRFFDYLHPGMRGRLHVVDRDDSVTTQAEIDIRSQAQFLQERAPALQVEQGASTPRFHGDEPGSRIYEVNVGLSAANNHVAIQEMLPQHLDLTTGDEVEYIWRDPQEAHTVTFPADAANLPGTFGLDCGRSFTSTGFCLEPGMNQPEAIADPGTNPSGGPLSDTTQLVDSGLLIGTSFGVSPSVPRWSVETTTATGAGMYTYQCTLHDWMRGTLAVHH